MIKRNIMLLCGLALLQGMVFYAPVATLYRQAAGLGLFHITLIESISLGLMIALEIPWGWLADRIGYKRTMLICCGLYFVSKLVFWQAHGFGGFLLERVLLSIVCAGLSGVDSSMLYLSCEEENSHRVFSIYQNAGEIGMLLAAMVYALFIKGNYRQAALWTAVSYGAAAVLALGLRDVGAVQKSDSEYKGRDIRKLLRQQLSSRKVILLLVAMALLSETHQVITVFLNQLQYVRSGMDHRGISAAYIAVSLMGLAGGFSARVSAGLGKKAMGTAIFSFSMVCCLVLAVFIRPVASVLSILVLRGCFSLMQPLHMDLQNKLIKSENRATALSLNAVVQDGLGIALNLLFGRIADISLSGAMLLGAALCGIGLLCFLGSKCYETK